MRVGGGSPARAFEQPAYYLDDMSGDVKSTSTCVAGENGTHAAKVAESTASEKHSDAACRKRKLSCSRDDRQPNNQQQQHSSSAPDGSGGSDRHHSPGGQKKRRFSHHYHHKNGTDRFAKRPNKFLLGGNVTDPLNLNALCADTEAGRALNEVTPRSSPLPLPQHRMLVDVLVPANIYDPLNLNANGDEASPAAVLLRRVKRKRHKKKSEKQPERIANLSSAAREPAPQLPDARPADGAADACAGGSSAEHHSATPAVVAGGTASGSVENARPVSEVLTSSEQAAPTKVVLPASLPGVNRGPAPRGEKKDTAEKATRQCRNRRQFIYGNYTSYYAYRNPEFAEDSRLAHFKEDWFAGKDVLDIGCNTGHITMTVARDLNPRSVTGIDIDPQLISLARKNMRFYIKDLPGTVYPASMAACYGPLAAPVASVSRTGLFPNNVRFIQANYSLEREELLDMQREEYDVILALSITKWLHLHNGDAGIKRAFRRMYKQLRPGGRLILEPQQWPSYKRRKRLTETIRKNYETIQFRPEQFSEYLLSKEVGFTTCEEINVESSKSKGFRRPLFVFTKASLEASQKLLPQAATSASSSASSCSTSAAAAAASEAKDNCRSSNSESSTRSPPAASQSAVEEMPVTEEDANDCNTNARSPPADNHAAAEVVPVANDASDALVRHSDNGT